MARREPQRLQGPQGLSPNAANVSRTVQAQAPSRSDEFLELAQGLSQVSPLVSRELEQRITEQQEADAKRGALDASAGRDPDAEATQAYLAEYHQRQGKLAGHEQFDAQLRAAYAESGLAFNDDPAAFKEFSERQRVELLKGFEGKPSAFQGGLLPVVDNALGNLAASHAAQTAKVITERARQDFSDEAALGLDNLTSRGAGLDEVGDYLSGLAARGAPLLGDDTAREAILDSVVNTAVAERDEELLDILDNVRDGRGVLSSGTEERKAIDAARERIWSRTVARSNQERTLAKYEREAREMESLQAVTDRLLENPEADPVELLEEFRDVPDLAPKVLALRSALRREGTAETVEATEEAWQAIIEEPTLDTVVRLVESGVVTDPSTVKQFMGIVRQTQRDTVQEVRRRADRVAAEARRQEERQEGIDRAERTRAEGIARTERNRQDSIDRAEANRLDGINRSERNRQESIDRTERNRQDSIDRAERNRRESIGRSERNREENRQNTLDDRATARAVTEQDRADAQLREQLSSSGWNTPVFKADERALKGALGYNFIGDTWEDTTAIPYVHTYRKAWVRWSLSDEGRSADELARIEQSFEIKSRVEKAYFAAYPEKAAGRLLEAEGVPSVEELLEAPSVSWETTLSPGMTQGLLDRFQAQHVAHLSRGGEFILSPLAQLMEANGADPSKPEEFQLFLQAQRRLAPQ